MANKYEYAELVRLNNILFGHSILSYQSRKKYTFFSCIHERENTAERGREAILS